MSQSNSTWGGMVAMNLLYHVHCDPCGRVVEVDMTKLPPDGNAIGATFRCSECGRPGSSIISHKSAMRSVPGRRSKA